MSHSSGAQKLVEDVNRQIAGRSTSIFTAWLKLYYVSSAAVQWAARAILAAHPTTLSTKWGAAHKFCICCPQYPPKVMTDCI